MQRIVVLCVFFLFFAISIITGAEENQENAQPAGIVLDIEGLAEVTAVNPVFGGTGYRNLKVNDIVYVGDKIMTAREQVVTLELNEDSEIMIGPESTFVVEAYRPGTRQETVLNLLNGVIKALVRKKYADGETFVIKTPRATMGVRGTEFLVQVNALNETTVHTLEGTVAMGLNIAHVKSPDAVLVPMGQMSFYKPGMQNPAPPVHFERDDLRMQLRKSYSRFEKLVNHKILNIAPPPVDALKPGPLPGMRPEVENGHKPGAVTSLLGKGGVKKASKADGLPGLKGPKIDRSDRIVGKLRKSEGLADKDHGKGASHGKGAPPASPPGLDNNPGKGKNQ